MFLKKLETQALSYSLLHQEQPHGQPTAQPPGGLCPSPSGSACPQNFHLLQNLIFSNTAEEHTLPGLALTTRELEHRSLLCPGTSHPRLNHPLGTCTPTEMLRCPCLLRPGEGLAGGFRGCSTSANTSVGEKGTGIICFCPCGTCLYQLVRLGKLYQLIPLIKRTALCS